MARLILEFGPCWTLLDPHTPYTRHHSTLPPSFPSTAKSLITRSKDIPFDLGFTALGDTPSATAASQSWPMMMDEKSTPLFTPFVQADTDSVFIPASTFEKRDTAALDLLRCMSNYSQDLRFSPMYRSLPSSVSSQGSSSSLGSQRGPDGSDLELGGSDWRSMFSSKRRQSRRSLFLLAGIIGSGLIYTLIDNFLLADWISAQSEYTPIWVGTPVSTVLQVPDVSSPGLPSEAWLGGGVTRIPDDPAHVLIPIPSTLPPAAALLQPIDRLPPSILVEYYTTGLLPSAPLPPIPNHSLDIVYTYVNASSPVLQAAKDARAAEEGLVHLGAARHWRDNGELRGAVRSAAQHLGKGLRKVHVISADFELDSVSPVDEMKDDDVVDEMEIEGNSYEDDEMPSWTVGQIPSWLKSEGEDVGIQWHFHSEIFRLPANDGHVDQRLKGEWQNEAEWRENAMPNFNSFQIEGRVGWMKDLGEHFILSNDDMFFFRDMNPADFHHPLLGPVFRLAPDVGLRVPYTLAPHLLSDSGEWGGLQHANTILSARFYPKKRMYMAHVPKSMTLSLAHEASVMFSSDFSLAATRGFRESKRGKADIHFAWLVTHLQMERWREAFLWSWAVARLGGEDGLWAEEEKEEVRSVLGLELDEQVDAVVVIQNGRATVRDMEGIMNRNDWPFPTASNYLFTSLDGHLPESPAPNAPLLSCTFSISQCLPSSFHSETPVSATDIFTHLTFEKPECGDCLIMALINASGPRGLSAVLPRADQVFKPEQREPEQWEREEPMLPLVPKWTEGNFSLASVVRPGQDRWSAGEGRADGAVGLREFCVKLLSRYVYSIATSPTHFALSRSPRELANVLLTFDSSQDVAMACLNDDQPDAAGDNGSASILGKWMEGRFGSWKAAWEREDWPWSPKTTRAQLGQTGGIGKATPEAVEAFWKPIKDSQKAGKAPIAAGGPGQG